MFAFQGCWAYLLGLLLCPLLALISPCEAPFLPRPPPPWASPSSASALQDLRGGAHGPVPLLDFGREISFYNPSALQR